MNIFVILIMGVMLATYQYFTTKRSSDIVLNKDELRLQAELTCMKQYHDYSASQNEAYKTEVPNFKGTGEGQVSYTCQGAEGIVSSKYCLDSAGNITACSGTVVKEHCVSTVKQKKFSKDERYLKTQILKSGVSIITGGKIKGKSVNSNLQGGSANQTTGEETILIGLISCVDAEKIAAQNKMEKNNCKEGEYPIVNPDGSIGCAVITDITPCTSHEEEVSETKLALCSSSTSVTGECSTQLISGKYCVPKASAKPKCRQDGQKVVWNRQLRFYVCDDATNYCTGNGTMLVRDDKDQVAFGGSKVIANAFTPQYDSSNSSFVCYPKANLYTSACKAFSNTDYAFLGVENLSSVAKGSGQAEVQPVCRLSAKANSNAVENCSPCETTEFDTLNNRWKCKPYPTFNSLTSVAGLIDQLRGVDGKTEKGIKGCFTGCTDEHIAEIKQGKRNGPDWGLVYNASARMWTCFRCEVPNTNYNNRCSCPDGKCVKGDIPSSCTQTQQGKCIPYNCSTEYQVQIDGECYTKWCNKRDLPDNMTVNAPTTNACPNHMPWMVYNQVKTCVYCIRPPSVRLEGESSTN